ncbi:hypothetical protein SD457_19755 [Coprobacillaceae bacterium CR2/5/TPMF4]|nr:hypothetical protein SD457_19755 [Coprobacillaceae bacterium CR2/5/TPMF4]
MIFISISYFRDKLIILNNLLNVLLIIFCYDNGVKNGGVKMNPAVAIVIMSIIEVIGINIFYVIAIMIKIDDKKHLDNT